MGQKVGLDFNGLDFPFTLDAHGASQHGSANQFKLQFKSSRGTVLQQTAKFTVKLTKGNFSTALASAGLIADPAANGSGVNLMITLIFNGVVYQSPVHLTYSVPRTGKSGTAK